MEHMQRVRHANRGRLLLRTPGPVPLWDLHVFLCRDQSLLNLSCLLTFEFRTPLDTSLLLSYDYSGYVGSDLHKALQIFVKWSNKASSRIYYDSIIHIKI